YLHTNRAPRFRTSGALRAEIDALNVALERVPARDPPSCSGVSSTSSGFRSRRNVSETGRNDQDPSSRLVAVPPAVAAGGFAHDAAEFLGEMGLIRESTP